MAGRDGPSGRERADGQALRPTGLRLDRVPKPHHPAIERLGGHVPEGLSGTRPLVRPALVLEDRLHAREAVDGRVDEHADLVDQPGFQEGAVDGRAALQQQGLDAERLAESVHRLGEVAAVRAGEQVGHAVLPQLRQVRVGHPFGEHGDGVVPVQVVLPVMDLAMRVDGDRQVPVLPVADERLARGDARPCHRPGLPLRDLLHGDAPAHPALGAELVGDLVVVLAEPSGVDAGGRPGEPARVQLAVDGRHHVADDLRAHRAASFALPHAASGMRSRSLSRVMG